MAMECLDEGCAAVCNLGLCRLNIIIGAAWNAVGKPRPATGLEQVMRHGFDNACEPLLFQFSLARPTTLKSSGNAS